MMTLQKSGKEFCLYRAFSISSIHMQVSPLLLQLRSSHLALTCRHHTQSQSGMQSQLIKPQRISQSRHALCIQARKRAIGTISTKSRHSRPAVHRKLGRRRAFSNKDNSRASFNKSKELFNKPGGKEPVAVGYGWRQMIPGDSGWDLFKVRQTDVKTFNRFREIEVIHARWAMLGVISLLLGDIAGSPLPPLNASLSILAPWGLVLLLSLAFIESYRLAALWNEEDYEKRTYPGQPFDFLGLTQPAKQQQADEQPPGLGVYASWVGGLPGWLAGGWWFNRREMTEVELLEMKGRELRNGRLAMVSFIGCCMASALTGKGPFTLLVQHISDPLHNTIVQTLQ